MLTCGFQGSDGSVGWNAVGENCDGDGVVWWEAWKHPVNQPIRPQNWNPPVAIGCFERHGRWIPGSGICFVECFVRRIKQLGNKRVLFLKD